MGPPIFIGGNVYPVIVLACERVASMGPPIFIGGNLLSGLDDDGSPLSLQWGHRFSSVEINAAETLSAVTLELQWGHRFSSVEMATGVSLR